MLGANEGCETGDVGGGKAVACAGHIALISPSDFDINAISTKLNRRGRVVIISKGVLHFVGGHGKDGGIKRGIAGSGDVVYGRLGDGVLRVGSSFVNQWGSVTNK